MMKSKLKINTLKKERFQSKIKQSWKAAISLLLILSVIPSCSALNSLENIMKLKFKIDSISNFEVQDISISAKNQLSDFSPTELLKLVQALTNKKLYASFTLNVDVLNPNAEKNSDNLNLQIVSFPWELFLNDRKIVTGNIQEPLTIAGNQSNEDLGIKISVNLFELLNSNNINEILKAALELGGKNSSTNKVALFAQPVIGTFIGNISYPEQIKIVDYEFR